MRRDAPRGPVKHRYRRRWMAAVTGVVLAILPSIVQADPGCRSQCDTLLRQCKQDCADNDDSAQCISDCQSFYQQCVAACG